MKLLSMLACTMLLSNAAIAAHELHCLSNDDKYDVLIQFRSAERGEGTVSIDGRVPQFGNLSCFVDSSTVDCRSEGVADAGYRVEVQNVEGNPPAKIWQISFFGETHLADLSCHTH